MARKKRKRLVLDMGASAIRLCELTSTKAGYQLTRYFQRDLVIDPETDDETRIQLRKEALNSLLKEAKVRQHKVAVGVPGQSVFTRPRPLPPVPEHKVTQIVRYEIQQQIPFSLDQIALDYQVLDRTEGGGYFVLMAAIKVDIVEHFLEPLKQLKKTPDFVDVCPLAAYNWLKQAGEFGEQGDTVALIDLGAATTDIVIEKENQFRWNRTLSVGGNDITRAIASEFGQPFEQAERLKRERAFAPTGDAQKDGKAGEVIGRVLTRLVGEINRSFAYYRSQPGGGPVSRVVITGGGACLRNIVPFLQRQLGMEVRIAQPLAGLAIAPGAQEVNERPEQAAVALGIALRCQQDVPIEINLIPPRILESARRKEQAFYWALSLVTLILILASTIPVRAQQHKQVKQNIEVLKQTLAMYDPGLPPRVDQRNLQQLQSQYEQQLDQVRGTVNDLQRYVQAMDAVFQKRTVWLSHLNALNEARIDVQEANPNTNIYYASVEATYIGDQGPGRGGFGGRRGGGGPGGGGPQGQRPLPSTGFPGISPGAGGGRGGFGMGMDMGFGGRGGRGGQPGEEDAGPELPEMNGLTVHGYATNPEAVTALADRLRASGAFIEGGVYLNEGNVVPVDASQMANPTPPSGGGGYRGGGMGGMDEFGMGGGGGFGARRGGGGGAQRQPTGQGRVISFRIDVQFKGEPVDLTAPEPAPGGGGFGGDPFMGF